jgi:hypothetical protein
MALDLSRLEAAVTRQKTVNDSAVTLMGQLAQLVRDTAGDPVAVTALADALDAQAQSLADAVVANTPTA